MKTYIKVIGPPILKSIKALEKIAVDMPQVCIMDTMIESGGSPVADPDSWSSYLDINPSMITRERCDNLISKSGESVGEYDFYFEWFKEPTLDELNKLIGKIDEVLAAVGSRYTIMSKK